MTELAELIATEAGAKRILGAATVSHNRALEAKEVAAKMVREATMAVDDCIRQMRERAAKEQGEAK